MKNLEKHILQFEAYLHSIRQSAHTVKQYIIDTKIFVQFANKQEQHLSDREICEQYYEHIQQTYSTISSVNRKVASIKKFMQYLADRDLMKATLMEIFVPISNPKKALVALTKEQVADALNVWPQYESRADTAEKRWLATRNDAIVKCIAELAIKPGELVKMRWSHIDQEHQKISILSTKSSRKIPISVDLIELLNHYFEQTIKLLPIADEVDEIWLGLGNKQGEPLSAKTVERIFQTISKELSVKVTCTNLRYVAIDNEADESELYTRLGYARKGVLKERRQRLKEHV